MAVRAPVAASLAPGRLPSRLRRLAAALILPATVAQAQGPVAQCLVCHPVEKGAPHAVGPNLYGVLGRRIAAVPGFAFSKALRAHSGTWTEDRMHQWLENPQAYAPGTKMAYAGMRDPRDRQSVIDFLKELRK